MKSVPFPPSFPSSSLFLSMRKWLWWKEREEGNLLPSRKRRRKKRARKKTLCRIAADERSHPPHSLNEKRFDKIGKKKKTMLLTFSKNNPSIVFKSVLCKKVLNKSGAHWYCPVDFPHFIFASECYVYFWRSVEAKSLEDRLLLLLLLSRPEIPPASASREGEGKVWVFGRVERETKRGGEGEGGKSIQLVRGRW